MAVAQPLHVRRPVGEPRVARHCLAFVNLAGRLPPHSRVWASRKGRGGCPRSLMVPPSQAQACLAAPPPHRQEPSYPRGGRSLLLVTACPGPEPPPPTSTRTSPKTARAAVACGDGVTSWIACSGPERPPPTSTKASTDTAKAAVACGDGAAPCVALVPPKTLRTRVVQSGRCTTAH